MTMDDIYHLIEGRYGLIEKEMGYTLFIAGPTNSKREYGEHFTFSTERNHVEWGIQEVISGPYTVLDDTLILLGNKRMQESWDRTQDQEEGEAFEEEVDQRIEVEIDPRGSWMIMKQDPPLKLTRIT